MAESKVRPRAAIVGGDSLLAKEVRELLEAVKPAPRIELISAAAESAVMLEIAEDDALALTPLTVESLTGARVAFLTGSPASSRRTLKLNPPDGPVLIDLTGALEEQPHARLRAPSAEAKPPSGVGAIQVIAHPAAIAVAALLAALSKRVRVRKSVMHVFEPASERGKRGIDELQKQTVSVLTFKKLKTDVYDSQLAFAMLARYGEEAEETLEGIEERVTRHLASLLAAYPAITMPSLRVVQAPVFHGHSFSAWVELEEDSSAQDVAAILQEAGIDIHPDDPPSNINIAGQTGLAAGAITVDPNQRRAFWIWMVADNIRLAADNAVTVAKEWLR